MSEDTANDTYTDFHRAFIQYFIAKNTYSERDLMTNMYPLLCKQYHRTDPVEQVIETVNSAMRPYGFQIGEFRGDREIYYAFHNKTNDAISKLTTPFDKETVIVLKALIITLRDSSELYTQDEIVDQLETQCTIERPKIISILKELISGNWVQTSYDYVDLGARAFLELHQWLDQLEVQECQLCHDSVLTGVLCPHDECGARLHTRCATNYQKRNISTCPKCGGTWTMTRTTKRTITEEQE
ncbi:hypothetical protein WA158_006390 [Blastocystis sp. Blastoise]